MNRRRALMAGLVAAVAGIGILLALSGKYHPESRWQVLPKADLVKKGGEVAKHFGLDTNRWSVSAVPNVSNALAYYQDQHPEDAHSHEVSPLSLRITYRSKQDHRSVQVGFDSAGRLIYFKPPDDYKGNQHYDTDRSAAAAVFDYFSGQDRPEYKPPVRNMGDKEHEEDYRWRTQANHFGFRKEIRIATKNATLMSAERIASTAFDESDVESGDGRQYWDVFAGIFALICVLALVIAFSIDVLWWVRKAVSHTFALRLLIASFVIGLIKVFSGVDWERLKATESSGASAVIGALFFAALVGCLAEVGRSISASDRPKWMSLEQLFRLAPLSRSTGESLAAGLLFSPLVLAAPLVIVACGVFPGSWVVPQKPDLLYSPAPFVDSFDLQRMTYLLGFFGFGLPFLRRILRVRWLRWAIIIAAGSLFFTSTVSGPMTAALGTGLLTLAIFWFVWSHFSLLAVLTLQFSSTLLFWLLILFQKGGGWSLALALACVAGAACVCYWRGTAVEQGDPQATVPQLSGFQAEREKLLAEFSVARRAQQNMLPRTPPRIPGYTIAASCTPSLDVGGDLYDFVRLPDGRLGIGVADVSGKGVPAALYMTLTKGLLAAVSKNSSDLPTVVAEINRHLHGVTRKRVFVTMVLGFLDPEKRLMECARAGHNPVVWRQASRDSTTLVSPSGLGLGITAGRVFGTQLKVSQIELDNGDAVVFYSDGITEAMNSSLEQFGEERLMEAVRKTDSLDALSARDSILGDVKEFLGGVHPQDDMTLVVLRVGSNHLI